MTNHYYRNRIFFQKKVYLSNYKEIWLEFKVILFSLIFRIVSHLPALFMFQIQRLNKIQIMMSQSKNPLPQSKFYYLKALPHFSTPLTNLLRRFSID